MPAGTFCSYHVPVYEVPTDIFTDLYYLQNSFKYRK